MKETNRDSGLHKDDTVLETDGIEGNRRLETNVIESVEVSDPQIRFSYDLKDDTELEIDSLEDNPRIEPEVVDLLLDQNSEISIDVLLETDRQSQIDIVLGQPSKNRDSHDTEGDNDIEIEGAEMDAIPGTAITGNDRDDPVKQMAANELLFDDEITNLNTPCQSGIARFHIGETSDQVNVKTWGPMLVSKWYMKMAKRGHSRAQYRLGCMYAMGSGVKQNQIMAYTWCKVAARQKSSRASSRLKEIESKLTSAHIYYAKKLSEQYYEMYVTPFQAGSKLLSR